MSSSMPEMIESVRQITHKDCHTLHEVGILVTISHGGCHKIQTAFKVTLVASKLVLINKSNKLTFTHISKQTLLVTPSSS